MVWTPAFAGEHLRLQTSHATALPMNTRHFSNSFAIHLKSGKGILHFAVET
jgi:hypothetical protein